MSEIGFYAHVENGVVISVIRNDSPIINGIEYIKCDQNVERGWLYISSENEFVPDTSDEVRQARNVELQSTDWWVIKAAETGGQISVPQAEYRQALRDLPSQVGFPYAVVWPEKPE